MALTHERIGEIATDVVIHTLENIGIEDLIYFIEDYCPEEDVSDDEFDDIYDEVQGLAGDIAQRVSDRDS